MCIRDSLLAAQSKAYDVANSLDAAIGFLKEPSKWEPSKRIPLGSALALAERLGKASANELQAVAKALTADQKADGSWESDGLNPILATWSARSTLISSGMQPDTFTIVQADRWIRSLAPENVLEAAATILALELSSDVMAELSLIHI